MSDKPIEDKNLDYAPEGGSVLEIHDPARRERRTLPAGQEPVQLGTLIACAIILIFGGGYMFTYANGFKFDTTYTYPGYTPAPRPEIAGAVIEEDTRPWIDRWLDGGKKAYTNCASCHQNNGTGQPGLYPPLVGSEWVDGGTERLAMILLHGANGPMTVAGKTYSGQQMPAWAILGDEKIAQVLSYVRAEFGNFEDPAEAVVTTEAIQAAREKYSDRANAWTEPELNAIDAASNLPAPKVNLETGEPISEGDAPPEAAQQ